MTDTTTSTPDAAAPRSRFPRPRAGHVAAAIAAAAVFLIVLFLLLFQWDWLRGPIARFASARTHRSIRIDGHLRVHLLSWTPGVTIEGLKIGEPAWGPTGDMARIGAVSIKVRLMPLFGGRVDLPLVEFDDPDVVLLQDRSLRANWDFNPTAPKSASKPFKLPPIEKFVIAGGRLRADIAPRRLHFAGAINSAERDSGTNAETFHMSGLGDLNARPFRLDLAGGPLIDIHRDQPYPFQMDVRGGDTHFAARGRLPHPFDFGQIEAALSLEGRDLNEVYNLTGLALPNTPPYRLSGDLVRDEKVYRITNLAGRVGGSDLEGRLTIDTGRPRTYLGASLGSKSLDFKDLAFLLGAHGKSAGAPPAEKPAVATAGSARVFPVATLQVERLRKMDADVSYRAQSVQVMKLPLRGVDFTVKLADGVLTIDPLRFRFPQGALGGRVRLDARAATPITDLDLRLSDVRMENFVPGGKGGTKPLEGVLQARAKLHGVGDSVHAAAATADGRVTAVIPHGQIRQAFAELLGIDATKGLFQLLSGNQHQTDIRCAVADFRVQRGVLTADHVVLDTGVVLVNGSGTINLGDESLALLLQGKPKSFRLIRLDAPITIGGHLASPSFGVKPGGAIAQGGLGLALAALVNPLLVVLPFIDPGLGKNADCAALSAEARSSSASVRLPSAPRLPLGRR